MILQSLRLKNIKSYGEGPDGNGITVSFQQGVNLVAGRNGHGKTTLIEALGYGLFFSGPDFEEGFKLPAYFLRAGKKEGEIDVVFQHGGQTYRVERGLGQSKRRSKIVQLSDGSTCAMDDAEVSACLCRVFGLKQQRQLADLFSNLIGVQQGRLTRPFDSKPAAAKEFFEPLLDVAIFRESTERLGDAQKRFRDVFEEHGQKLAAIAERVHWLDDSPGKVPIKEAEVEALARAVEKSRKHKEATDQAKQVVEQKQTAFNAARTALEETKNQLRLASQQRESEQQRLNESVEAASMIKKVERGYQAYLQAEARLRVLQQHQQQKSALQQQRAEMLNLRTEWQGKKDGALKQARDYGAQMQEKAKHAEALCQQLAEGKKRLQDSQAEFESLAQAASAAKRSRDAIDAWLETLVKDLDDNQQLLGDIVKNCEKIEAWDAHALTKARAEEQRLDEIVRELGRKVAKAEEAKTTLSEQLAQISGGVCPFLKEKCRQFDPKAIQSDLTQREKDLLALGKQHQESVAAHARASKAAEKLAEQEAGLAQLRNSVADKVHRFVDQHTKLFPGAIQKHFALLHNYLPNHIESLTELWENASSSFTSETKLDTRRLCALADAGRDCFQAISKLLQKASPALDKKLADFEKLRADRVRAERDLHNASNNLDQAQAERKLLSKKIEDLNTEAAKAETQVNSTTARIADVEEKLKTFANLEQDGRQQHELKDQYAEDHKLFLGAKPLADKLEERRAALHKSSQLELTAQTQSQQKTEAFESASRDFDPAALEDARNSATAAGLKLTIESQALKDAERELKEQKQRFKQWKEACAERARINDEIGRLKAASNLAKLAGKVLRDAAPAVAQRLCSRIAGGAQRIFNQINPDPVELEWKAEPQYSLRVSPSDRRFAMLSGGEQTKLALAMTLAMIEQFSALRFAVFDEPTYGVDADSRQKLADAIIQAQKAAGLDQLILVSHDNAFEGKIEHVVLLNKTSATGTEVIISA